MNANKFVLVKEVMTAPAVSVNVNVPLLDAVKKMNKFRIGSIVVVNSKHQPIGITTERDILLKVVEHCLQKENAKIKDVMSRPVHIIKESSTVEIAAKIMADKGIRRLPVVQNRRLVGLLTSTDIVKTVAKGLFAHIPTRAESRICKIIFGY